jgi:GNAT superfamily N-acetyltransferase
VLHTALVVLNTIVPRPLLDVRVWVVARTDLSAFVDAEVPDVGVYWVGTADVDGLALQDAEQAGIEDQLARGKVATVIERDGRIVGWETFTSEDFAKEDWLWIAVRDREIYEIRMFVEPEYRGQGLAVWLNRFAYREFARQGYLLSYGVTDALNRRSLRAAAKVCHRPVGRIVYGRCFGFAVIRIGRRLRAGSWTADSPLVIDFSAFDNP